MSGFDVGDRVRVVSPGAFQGDGGTVMAPPIDATGRVFVKLEKVSHWFWPDELEPKEATVGQFRIGDRVRVATRRSQQDGERGTVADQPAMTGNVLVSFGGGTWSRWFPSNELEHVDEPEPAHPRPRVYIAGPISSVPDDYERRFNTAKQVLTAAGFEPVSPLDLDGQPAPDQAELEPGGVEWRELLRRDLKTMLDCDGVALLPGWTESQGARLEEQVASRVGIPTGPIAEWVEDAIEGRRGG